ncbi:hypothetical protein FOZ62_006988, partial [Perkinsus olseni]
IAIHGLVADVTKFKDEHPGGESILMRHVGTDCTEDYDDVDHSDEARMKLIEEVAIGSAWERAAAVGPISSDLGVLEGNEDTPGIPVETKLGDIQDSGWSSMQAGRLRQAGHVYKARSLLQIVLVTAVVAAVAVGVISSPDTAVIEEDTGDTMLGFVKDDRGMWQGDGTILYKNGAGYSGAVVDSRREGLGVYIAKGGAVYRGEWK